ncbi:MAG: hypothetical protein LAO03_13610 [Acidobacteriia bacterium]|nr:hypothetical protein [Terriglobia bacterium]
MPISAVDTLSPAFQHTKQQLLQPFRVGQWAKLALVGFLAGELSSGGCNTSSFQLPTRTSGSQQLLDYGLRGIDPALYAGLIAVLIVAALVLGVLFLYVGSVMRFVLFDSILAKSCEIRKSWGRRQGPGLRYFLWQILLLLGFLAGMIILVGIPAAFAFAAGWLKEPSRHTVPLVLGGMLLFMVLFAFVACWFVVHVMTKDFVVPQMALEDVSAMEGWRRFWPMLKTEKGGYAGYIGLKIVMAIGAAVLVSIISTIVILILLIPVGGVGAVLVLGGKAAGLQWNLYTITLAVVVGTILVGLILYVISLVSVPPIVFFPAYSIYFFASRYPALQQLLYPAPPAPVIPVATPPLPPPLPPPEPIG